MTRRSGVVRNRILVGCTVVLLLVVAVAVALSGRTQPSTVEREQAFLLVVRSGENPDPDLRQYGAADLVGIGRDACLALRERHTVAAAAQSLVDTGLPFRAAVFMTVAARRSLCPDAA